MADVSKIKLPNGSTYDIAPYDANIKWGGKESVMNNIPPIDSSMVPELGANRFAYLPANNITVEYSRDGGETWIDYGASIEDKTNLFVNRAYLNIGKNNRTSLATNNHLLRISINFRNANIHTVIQKVAVEISRQGSEMCWCTVDSSPLNDTNNFTTLLEKASISGWSGWNILNLPRIVYGGDGSNVGILRFTFGADRNTGLTEAYTGLQILGIRAFGGMGWTVPSNMAKNGHLYYYDANQNAIFPADIKATNVEATKELRGKQVYSSEAYIDTISGAQVTNMENTQIVIIPTVKYSDLGIDPADASVYKVFLKWICQNYPRRIHTIFVGNLASSSYGVVIVRIYDTSSVDSDTGLPKYSSGSYLSLYGNEVRFGTALYNFYLVNVLDSSNYSNYLSNKLLSNSILSYGDNSFQYFNINTEPTSGPSVNAVPVSNRWFHILRMNHNNNAGYFSDIAVGFNNTSDYSNKGIWYRTIANGVESQTFKKLIDEDDLQIGGFNLLDKYLEAGGNCTKISDTSVLLSKEDNDTFFYLKPLVPIEIGKTYTLSFTVSGYTEGDAYNFRINNKAGYDISVKSDGRFVYTFEPKENLVNGNGYLPIDDTNNRSPRTTDVTFSDFKLEEGKLATYPENLLANEKNHIPFIEGTQTAVTNAWTGNAPTITKLYDGLTINYWLPYNGTSTGATLSLTKADGTETGPINCYYGGSTKLTTHYPAGNIIQLTYRDGVSINGSSTKYYGWWAKANYNSDIYDRERMTGGIKAGTAIIANSVIVGKNGLYQPLNSGNSFDITYPILLNNNAVAANATTTTVFQSVNFAVANTQSITLTPYKPVYIKGTLDRIIFTPISATPLTQDIPTVDDGYQYIRLGYAYANQYMKLEQIHPIYEFKNGSFRLLGENDQEVYDNAGYHNSIYRGKFLGNTVTIEQWEEIQNGTFKDLYVGDYWQFDDQEYGTIVCRIAGFDLYYKFGYPKLTNHHLVMTFDKSIANSAMFSSDDVTAGYYGSLIKTSGLNSYLEITKDCFGEEHVLSHKAFLDNSIDTTNSVITGVAWYDSQIDIMNEEQVFGTSIYRKGYSGEFSSIGIDFNQFPLFRLAPSNIICESGAYWLRTYSKARHFSFVNTSGLASVNLATTSIGVRPYFLIG